MKAQSLQHHQVEGYSLRELRFSDIFNKEDVVTAGHMAELAGMDTAGTVGKTFDTVMTS